MAICLGQAALLSLRFPYSRCSTTFCCPPCIWTLLLRTVILTTSPTVRGITSTSTQSCRTPSRSAAQMPSWWRARPRKGQERPDVLDADATLAAAIEGPQPQCGGPSSTIRRRSAFGKIYIAYIDIATIVVRNAHSFSVALGRVRAEGQLLTEI